MTLQRPRDPADWSSAAASVVSAGLLEEAADELGKSTSLVRAWSDPNDPAVPNLRQAVALDRLMADRVGRRPFFDVYRAKMAPPQSGGQSLTELLLSAVAENGDVVRAIQDALADGMLTAAERERACQQIREARAALDKVEAQLCGPRGLNARDNRNTIAFTQADITGTR